MAPYAIAAALLAGLAAGVLVARRLTARREDVRQSLVVGESPRQALDRAEAAAAAFRGYASERRGWELVLFRRHQGPLGFFEDPEGFMAEATMDVLHVSAQRGDTGTEVALRGRCEPRVVNAVLRALAEAPPA